MRRVFAALMAAGILVVPVLAQRGGPPPSGQPPAGRPPAGQPPSGQPPAGRPTPPEGGARPTPPDDGSKPTPPKKKPRKPGGG